MILLVVVLDCYCLEGVYSFDELVLDLFLSIKFKDWERSIERVHIAQLLLSLGLELGSEDSLKKY